MASTAGVNTTRRFSGMSITKNGFFHMSKRDREVSGFRRTRCEMNSLSPQSDVRPTQVLNSSWNQPLEMSSGEKRKPCSTREMNSR